MKNLKKILLLLLITTLFVQITGCIKQKTQHTKEFESTNTESTQTDVEDDNNTTLVPEGATITLTDGTVVSPDELPEGVELVPKGSSTTKIP